jgi:NHLM bacteriocin system ABC transporter ATP-binding protein
MPGLYEDQIRDRVKKNNERVAEALRGLASVVIGKTIVSKRSDRPTHSAVEEICRFYKVPFPENEKTLEGEEHDQLLERLLRPSGVMRRRVRLEGEWWKNASGAFLGQTQSGAYTALIPKTGGYTYMDYETGYELKIGRQTAPRIKQEAVCFYRPLPNGILSFSDLFKFMLSNISSKDAAVTAIAVFVVTLLGMFTPYVTQLLFGVVIPTGDQSFALSTGALLSGVAMSVLFITVFKTLATARIAAKLDVAVESAVIARVVNLPVEFFKDYSAGDLTTRIMSLNAIVRILCNVFFGIVLTTLFSFVYLIQISGLAPGMALPAFAAILVQFGAVLFEFLVNVKVSRKTLHAKSKVAGIVFALFSGVQKIKLAACEKRAFFKWAKAYKEQSEAAFNTVLLPLAQGLRIASPFIGAFIIMFSAIAANISATEFVAFMSAYGLLTGALITFFLGVPMLGPVAPIMEMIDPVLKTAPEVSENKQVIKQLNGNIEMNNISFRYTENSPMIIDNLNLKIKRGQYIAIVGQTGCGKSTLFRLLLGFETPQSGAIYYDNTDISKIDLRSLRQKLGVVLQNGKLFQGDIFSNITISAPHMTLDEAWEAAETAGIAEAIHDMPMGMHTVVSEGGGGISGGQRQRILIARAIAPKPKVLFFDEATSALDNITQKQVSDSLAALKSTRIVIAHRLSTIRQCDRIVMLDKGTIIEDGTYDELIALGGNFAELVKRQRLEGERED